MSKTGKIAALLDNLNIKYSQTEKSIHLRWKTNHFDNLRIKIAPSETDEWIHIVALFSSFNDIEKSLRYQFAKKMLQASWKYNGIKFALSDQDDVIVAAQTNDVDLTEGELQTLIDNVVHGCEILWDISYSLKQTNNTT
ncbi:MAG: hypothetical protein ACFFD3_08260 [Candidatus Thorarchaeota archaeon]